MAEYIFLVGIIVYAIVLLYISTDKIKNRNKNNKK